MPKYLVFDGETCATERDEKGRLDVSNGQVYDLGGLVIDENCNIYDGFSVINTDVFFGLPEAMKEAYFANKIPQYMRDIWNHKRKCVNTWEMWRIFTDMCKRNDVQAVVAHNIWFDINVLNSTMRYQTKSKKRFFLPYNMPTIDTMELADKTICKTADYISFCNENNYMTKHTTPRPQKTAEVLWRYISGNNDFQESHTGFEDVMIEAQIFSKCMKMMKE